METVFSRMFGRRKGRPLSDLRQNLIDDLLPRLRPVWEKGGAVDLAALFGQAPRKLVLEIGFGGGERLAQQAAQEPETSFIGCEPFINGVAKALAEIDKGALRNVRLHPEDARPLMEALPEACLDEVYVLYADPWPKKRHAERRFIGPENLDRLERLMKMGAELRLATDVPVLADWMREQADKHPAFEKIYDSAEPPAGWISTRYEQKGLLAGRKPVYFIYRRCSRQP